MINSAPLLFAAICFGLLSFLKRGSLRRAVRQVRRAMDEQEGVRKIPLRLGVQRRRKDRENREEPHHDLPRAPRRSSILIAAMGAFVFLGIVPWQDLLANWTASETGLTALVVAGLAGAGAAWYEVRHLDHYHEVLTAVSSFTAGTVLTLCIAERKQLLHLFPALLHGSGKALSKAQRHIGSGQAAHAAKHVAPFLTTGTIFGVVVACIFLAVALGLPRWIHRGNQARVKFQAKRSEDSPRALGGSNRRAIGA